VAVDPASAVTTAESFMVTAGRPGTAWVAGNTVYAQINYREPTQLLDLIGVTSLQITVTESATDISGVTSEG